MCHPHKFWPSPLFKSVFGICLVQLEFTAPLLILVYCYGRIFWVLTRRIDSNMNTTESNANSYQSVKFQIARTNTIKTFLLISICFVICWISNQVYYLMYNLGYNADLEDTFYKFATLMAFLNCIVNPFVYLFKYRDYHIALKSCFGCLKTDGLEVKSSFVSTIETSFHSVQ